MWIAFVPGRENKGVFFLKKKHSDALLAQYKADRAAFDGGAEWDSILRVARQQKGIGLAPKLNPDGRDPPLHYAFMPATLRRYFPELL